MFFFKKSLYLFQFFFKKPLSKPLCLAISSLFLPYKYYSIKTMENSLINEENQSLEEIIGYVSELFLKNLVINGLFSSNQLVNEGSVFVEFLSEHEILQQAVQVLLVRNMKTEVFEASGKVFAKQVVGDLVNQGEDRSKNQEILQEDINYLILRTLIYREKYKPFQSFLRFKRPRDEA